VTRAFDRVSFRDQSAPTLINGSPVSRGAERTLPGTVDATRYGTTRPIFLRELDSLPRKVDGSKELSEGHRLFLVNEVDTTQPTHHPKSGYLSLEIDVDPGTGDSTARLIAATENIGGNRQLRGTLIERMARIAHFEHGATELRLEASTDEALTQVFDAMAGALGDDTTLQLGPKPPERPELEPRDHQIRRLRGELIHMEEFYEQGRLTDRLTGIGNRDAFDEALSLLVDKPGYRPTVMFIDLDGFKGLNDDLGHAVGDTALGDVADRLRSAVRSTESFDAAKQPRFADVVARLGGDEFGVVLANADPMKVLSVAMRIADAIELHYTEGDVHRVVRASMGISLYDDAATAEELLLRADASMYEAKRATKAHVLLHGEQPESFQRFRVWSATESS
jgi:diguanylate cyclase (GGDEF)-like protein